MAATNMFDLSKPMTTTAKVVVICPRPYHFTYSWVPNNAAVSNKRPGWKIFKKFPPESDQQVPNKRAAI